MANYVISFRVPADYKPTAETPNEWKAWFGGLGPALVDVGRAMTDYASAGERTSMNLPDIELEQLHRGQQVLAPNTLRPSQIITARLDLLAEAKPLKEQTRIRFHHLAAELLGSIRFVDETTELQPGRSAFVQVRLESPVV